MKVNQNRLREWQKERLKDITTNIQIIGTTIYKARKVCSFKIAIIDDITRVVELKKRIVLIKRISWQAIIFNPENISLWESRIALKQSFV